jgi:3-methyladenine DNA glycosylase AlkD
MRSRLNNLESGISHLESIRSELRAAVDPDKAAFYPHFFKTGPGEYGEGDLFLGVVVPKIRKIMKRHLEASRADVLELLGSPYHEERLAALLILVEQYRRSDRFGKDVIYRLYLSNSSRINNWDLVDVTAPHIVGEHLYGKDTSVLTKLARSKNLWERRIAILSTHFFIRRGESRETLRISELLLGDSQDLIHKAVGWMLREVGQRCSIESECMFLDKHAEAMPRTMLRYAIERFPEHLKQRYMNSSRRCTT